ncbi:unnamed protein product [Kuraishia capsulata CBS 1993]|uniref:Dynactin subunit 4 n=1 Tax=Kuraishia capsulata CBS 1993 TaxID=1382522 RepID=W6MRC3_9ASCO|nr:uncharacterized protein KUCA_T00005247001 [Kuraishia capsulata CBS 1993]CDK29259.1 unnamed protein product [Kuraishia capsulata CBS 1993]
MPVSLFCPCSEPMVSSEDISMDYKLPRTIGDTNTHHALSDLYFCNDCRALRCRKCSEPQIEFKFCARCRHKADPHEITRVCPKNCFDCPKCAAPLSAKSQTHAPAEGRPKGKSFLFSCGNCDWTYDTGVETRPRPLKVILQDQRADMNTELFDRLREHYALEKDIRSFLSSRKVTSDDLVGRVTPDQLARLMAGKRNSYPDFEPTDSDSYCKVQSEFPESHPLSTRISHICKACRGDLVKLDRSDFLSTKFYKISSASDVLPEIEIFRLSGKLDNLRRNSTNNLCVNFANSQSFSLEINVSTLTYLSSDLDPVEDSANPGVEHGHMVKLTLPCQRFTLGPRPDKFTRPENLVQGIPTIALDQESKASRVELIAKRSASLGRLSSGKIDTTRDCPLDEGANWATIPLLVEIGEVEEGIRLRLPLFVTVHTTHQISPSHPAVPYGFWAILDLGPIAV